jgi:hypothetical protein
VTTARTPDAWAFETITVHIDGPVLLAEILAPPMNLLGPELVRDLVSLIQRAEANQTYKVLVFRSADPDYFISHVDLTRIPEYWDEAASPPGREVEGRQQLRDGQPGRHESERRSDPREERSLVRIREPDVGLTLVAGLSGHGMIIAGHRQRCRAPSALVGVDLVAVAGDPSLLEP